MKRMVAAVACLALAGLVGCGLTAAEKKELADDVAQRAGDIAAAKASQAAAEKGLSPADTATVVNLARSEATDAAHKLLDQAIPEKEGEKRSNVGGVISTILMGLLHVALGMGAKSLGVPA